MENSFLLQVKLVVNGWQAQCLVLDYPYATTGVRQKSVVLHPQLCLGHIDPDPSTSNTGKWNLGKLMLFKGKCFNNDRFIQLLSNTVNIVYTEISYNKLSFIIIFFQCPDFFLS